MADIWLITDHRDGDSTIAGLAWLPTAFQDSDVKRYSVFDNALRHYRCAVRLATRKVGNVYLSSGNGGSTPVWSDSKLPLATAGNENGSLQTIAIHSDLAGNCH